MKDIKGVPAGGRSIDMEAPVLDLDDAPAKDGDHVVTLRDLCIQAVLAVDREATEIDKLDRFLLAMALKKKRHPKLRAEDITLLKKQIGQLYPPLYVYRAFQLLDPSDSRLVEKEREAV